MMEMSQDNVASYLVNLCCWILCDEGIHVWWDEDQIMKVINLKKQPKS